MTYYNHLKTESEDLVQRVQKVDLLQQFAHIRGSLFLDLEEEFKIVYRRL